MPSGGGGRLHQPTALPTQTPLTLAHGCLLCLPQGREQSQVSCPTYLENLPRHQNILALCCSSDYAVVAVWSPSFSPTSMGITEEPRLIHLGPQGTEDCPSGAPQTSDQCTNECYESQDITAQRTAEGT